MCGIIGIFGREDSVNLVRKGLNILKYRGKDGSGIFNEKKNCIGHCLHSVVGDTIKQPLKGAGTLSSNCEIYNWEDLNKKLNLNAKNDSELILKLLEIKKIKDVLNLLDGVYAFAYWIENDLYLARDIIGIKPVWYSHTDGFAFASEKKALEKLGYTDINELNPRKILKYSIKNNRIEFIEREFFDITPEIKSKESEIKNKVSILLKAAIKKRIPKRKFGLLFSGGIDSTIIAFILKKLKCNFTCYTAVLDDPKLKTPQDLVYAKKVAKDLDLSLKIIKVKLKDVNTHLKTIVPLIEDSNVVKAGVALTFYAACQEAKKDGCKVIFSGLGSEEIFAGYKRHKDSYNLNKECLSGILKIYERDLYRDDVITMFNNLELRLPFLDNSLVDYALKIPADYKLSNNQEKYILRLAAKSMGLKKEFTERRKKAAQYGSNFHKAIGKLAKKSNFKLKSEYLRTFYPTHNLRLGALVSSGKDSIYALYVMLKQNYSVNCIITIQSKNPDSFMFHTPSVELVKLQAEAMNLPLIFKETKGEKEKELKDLKIALKEAKETYKIDGVITGALFSSYQRDRIEKIADSLGLKIFSPLWHIDQETEMREIVNQGFEVIVTSIAADGLDKSFLGKKIDSKMIDYLVELNRKNKINIAFEGGEAESLVLNCPIFKSKIVIKEAKKIIENEFTGIYKITKAELE